MSNVIGFANATRDGMLDAITTSAAHGEPVPIDEARARRMRLGRRDDEDLVALLTGLRAA